MWEILDDRKHTILSILEKSSVSIRDLSNALSVSEKTLKNDIQTLNHLLKDGAYIYLKNGYISLFIYNLAYYKDLKNTNMLSSTDLTNTRVRILLLLKKLLADDVIILDDLAEDLTISKTTLTKDIKLANEGLEKYRLEIAGRPNVGVSLRGDEKDIRFFILENAYNEVIGGSEFYEKYNTFLNKLLLDYFIEQDTYESFVRYFNLSMYRISQDKLVKLDDGLNLKIKTPDIEEFAKTLKSYMKNELARDVPIDELEFVLIPLLGMRTPLKIKLSDQDLISDEIRDLADEIFYQIRRKMDINVDLGESLENFLYHLYFLLNRISLSYSIENPLSENIKEEYRVAYRMSEIAADVIYQKLGKVINDSEKAYLASYFQIYLFDKLSNSPINKFKLAVVDESKKTQEEISSLIANRFGSSNAIDYFTAIDDIRDFNSYDLIVATTMLNRSNVVSLPEGLKNPHIAQKEIDDYYFKNDFFQRERTINSLIFTELREESFYNSDEEDYETNLVQMLEEFEKRNLIDEKFTNDILERETLSSTIFADHVAFPHIKSSEFFLGIGIFPASAVKMIVVVGVPEDDDTLIINLYDEIVTLATDKKVAEGIGEVNTYRQLIEFIIRDTELFR